MDRPIDGVEGLVGGFEGAIGGLEGAIGGVEVEASGSEGLVGGIETGVGRIEGVIGDLERAMWGLEVPIGALDVVVEAAEAVVDGLESAGDRTETSRGPIVDICTLSACALHLTYGIAPIAMNDYQRAKLNTYRATLSTLDRYPSEVAAVGALQRSVDWVRARVTELEAAAEKQAEYVAQGTAKDEVLDALAEATVPVAQALAAKADEAGDSAAADLYDFVTTDITHSTDQDAIDRAGIVLTAAQATDPAELEDVGATAESVAALAEAYAAFRKALTEPRDAIAVRSAHTAVIERLVPEIGAHLRKRTDRLMTRYRGTTFGTEYKTARTVVDP